MKLVRYVKKGALKGASGRVEDWPTMFHYEDKGRDMVKVIITIKEAP
jgi:hypothetical protein